MLEIIGIIFKVIQILVTLFAIFTVIIMFKPRKPIDYKGAIKKAKANVRKEMEENE